MLCIYSQDDLLEAWLIHALSSQAMKLGLSFLTHKMRRLNHFISKLQAIHSSSKFLWLHDFVLQRKKYKEIGFRANDMNSHPVEAAKSI